MRTKPRTGAILDSMVKGADDRADGDGRLDVPAIGLRPAAACKALGVSRRTLCSWVSDRSLQLPHVRIGKVLLFPERELRDWLAARIERVR